MRKSNRTAARVLLAILLLGALAVLGACGKEQVSLERVVDSAGLFTAAEKAQLEDHLAEARAYSDVDYAIVTTEGRRGLSEMDYADWFLTTHGEVATGRGVVLLIIDMAEREILVVGSGEVEQQLATAYQVDAVLDPVFERIDAGWFAAADAFATNAQHHFGPSASVRFWRTRTSPVYILVVLAIGLAGGGLVVGILTSVQNSHAPRRSSATGYVAAGEVRLTHQVDAFTGTHTSRVPIPRDPPSSGGGGGFSGGGGGTRTFSGGSSSGRSFSGGGRKF